MKDKLFFPKSLFRNIKSIEKQKSYGAQSSEHYWMAKNYEKYDFEYYETLKITSYCLFEFSSFPFDTNDCDLLVGSSNPMQYITNLKPTIVYGKFSSQEKSIPIESKNVPFEMKAESITPFTIEKNDLNFSYTGVRITFKRNDLGLLIGTFYGPTATFSAFSILSYNIDMDMVRRKASYPSCKKTVQS